MTPGELNLAWARSLLGALVDLGLEEVQVAPGSRSTPLVLACHTFPALRVRVHLDERSAAFFALGYGRRLGRPCAVTTTSGTAVANLLPAVVEADMSDVPMILVTADRPPALRGADANQTIRQTGVFRDFARARVDLPVPDERGLADAGPDSLAGIVSRTARRAFGPAGGPVHLNASFDKPLEPDSAEDFGAEIAAARRAAAAGRTPAPAPRALRPTGGAKEARAVLGRALARARRPLLVAGPAADPFRTGPAVVRLARRWSLPAMADPLSGARFPAELDEGPDRAPVLGAYDHCLQAPDAVERLRPDLILRSGRTPTSAALERALVRWADVEQIVVDDGAHPKDHQRLASVRLAASAADAFSALARTESEPTLADARRSWARRWLALEDAAWEAVAVDADDADNEGAFAAAALRATPPGSVLYASSSMPVRDVDAYGRPAARDVHVLGNRGASGIDGVVSSALGCAAAARGAVVALLGDLAFYHDMNGLLAARDADLNAVLVLVDNDGGGIFHMLPVREFEPVFTPCFATPHGLDFEVAARLYGLPFRDAATPDELERAVARSAARAGTQVVRVRTDRERNRKSHERVRERVARRAHRVLNRETT